MALSREAGGVLWFPGRTGPSPATQAIVTFCASRQAWWCLELA